MHYLPSEFGLVLELQLKTLFKNLKNADGLVDINVLIRNLTGKDFATVDFRERVYRQLYNEIFPNNEERILKLFQEIDTTHLGLGVYHFVVY